MINFKTKELEVSPDKIRKVSLEYVVNLLKNDEPDSDVQDDVELTKMVHVVRQLDRSKDDPEDNLNQDDIDTAFEQMKKKGDKYKFILKAGNNFKNCLGNLYQKVWTSEEKPQQWRNTTIIQLYKGKGVKEDPDMLRNIHTKDEYSKGFDQIIVNKSKAKMIQKCSKFQIGAIQGHRPQEHLFTLKSMMAYHELLNKPLIVQLYDLEKYFDKELLRDAMSSLHAADVRGKLYRLWYLMTCDNQIRVLSSAGMTDMEPTGENVGQGTIGGAILSSLNLDVGVTEGFSESCHEVYYGGIIRLNPLLFQDDSLRLATSAVTAQYGNNIMESVMKRKLLNINDKSSFMLCGKPDKIKSIQEAIKNNPLSIKGQPVKQKSKEKYLGDMISSLGVSDSVRVTINDRHGRIISSIFELSSILEDFRMQTAGGLMSGLNIWRFGLLPSLLANAESWTEIPTDCMQSFESIQNLLLQKIFSVPKTTPNAALRWDTGSVSLEMQINKKKLLFLYHLIKMDEKSLAKEIFEVQVNKRLPGLADECKILLTTLNLPDIFETKVISKLSQLAWKRMVNNSILEYEERNLKSEASSKSKLKDKHIDEESFQCQSYISELNIAQSRLKFQLRSQMLDVKFNYSAKHERDLWLCDSCSSAIETQSHILFCPAYSSLREGKDIQNDQHLLTYIQSVMNIRTKLNLRK